MPTVTAPEFRTFSLDAGQVLTVSAATTASGAVVREGNAAGDPQLLVYALALGENKTWGPFNVPSRWTIRPSTGTVTFTQAGADVLTPTSGLRVAHATYNFAVDGGAQATIAPVNSDTIPDNAVIVGATINSTTAVTSGGSATVAVGTSSGSSTTSLLAATAKTSFTLDAVLNGAATLAAPVKMTAAGTITFTIGTATLLTGVIEVWVYYVVAAN